MKLMDDRIHFFHLNSLPFRKFLNVFILAGLIVNVNAFLESPGKISGK